MQATGTSYQSQHLDIFDQLIHDFKEQKHDPVRIQKAKTWYSKFTGRPCELNDQEILEIYNLLCPSSR